MEILTITPDNKLKTKIYLIYSTIALFLLIVAFILQFTIPLGGHVYYSEVATILWPIVLGVILLLYLLGGILAKLWIDNLEFIINEERITIKKGIITKIEQNIPFRAITDFQLHRSLYDRMLGIGSLRIQTAGQTVSPTGYEGNLAGLIKWQSLLEELRSRVREYHEQHESKKNAMPESPEEDKLTLLLEEVKQIRKYIESK